MNIQNDHINLQLNERGIVENLKINDLNIPFRQDFYNGFSFFAVTEDREYRINLSCMDDSKSCFSGELFGVVFSVKYEVDGSNLHVKVTAYNTAEIVAPFKRIFIRIGVDSYMDSFPDWNRKYFPTLLRCEKTHFYGYMMSPQRDVVAIASGDPIASWSLDYNRAIYWDEMHVGHRIYTACVDLINTIKQPERHPGCNSLQGKMQISAVLVMTHLDSLAQFDNFVHSVTAAPTVKLNKYTIEPREKLEIITDGKIEIITPDGCLMENDREFSVPGVYKITSSKNGKISEALLYVREKWSWYLTNAALASLQAPQKASTHTETWYGFFSGFLAIKHGFVNDLYKSEILKTFYKLFNLMFQGSPLHPVEKTIPGRIQNTALMISLLTDVYEAIKDKELLKKAGELADFLISHQSEDGAYRNGEGTHYTCVVYPAKSMLELYLCEKEVKGFKTAAQKHYNSAVSAINNLASLGDNIQTEGEQTFEDGMISCESLQLGMLALINGNDKKYSLVAEQILKKHLCLEQAYVPDCRMRGATLRFWESMYDVLINRNMINSPHGWTSWKTYATFYLYLLTGEYQYLLDTMDTLGACVQCVDLKSHKLKWAFVVDPCIETEVFVNRTGTPFGELKPMVVSEQYVDMLSYWWRSSDEVVYGYAHPDIGRVDGDYKGGCCDNDVHEHFKCLEEVALCNAFIHEMPDGTVNTFNCRIENDDTVVLSEDMINTVFMHCDKNRKFCIKNCNSKKHSFYNGFEIYKII